MEVVLIVEVHRAVNSPAKTEFRIPKEKIVKYRREDPKNRTHWREYYLLSAPTIVEAVRVSNRGNITVRKINVVANTYIDFMLNTREPTPEELEAAKYMLGLNLE